MDRRSRCIILTNYLAVFSGTILWIILGVFPESLSALPLPFDPSLDVTVTIHGQFVNWETGKRGVITVQPQLLWALTNELPTQTNLLQRAIKNEWHGARLFQPKIWQQWQHRTTQALKAPDGWLVWDVSNQPLQLRVFVRDNKKRLAEMKLVTVSEEITSKAYNGAVEAIWRIKPTDAAVLILRDKTGVLAFLLVRWTPIVYAERVGIVSYVGTVPIKIGQCGECQKGKAIASELYLEMPPIERGFVRVYRRLKMGKFIANLSVNLPHSPLKPIVDLPVGQESVAVELVQSIPKFKPQEAAIIICKEVRKGTLYKPAVYSPEWSRGLSNGGWRWDFYDFQRRRYVVSVWEVRVREGALPPSFSSYNAVAYQTKDIAQEIVKGLPLSPPNNVAAVLVEKLRMRLKEWRIGLMPRATLWVDSNVVKQTGSFADLPTISVYEQHEWKLKREFLQHLRKGEVPLVFSWTNSPEDINNGLVNLKWVRWLKPEKRFPPKQREFRGEIGKIVLVHPNAEYEVEPKPPEGFNTVPSFRLTFLTEHKPVSFSMPLQRSLPIDVAATESKVKVGISYHYTGNYLQQTPNLVVRVDIPLTLIYLWELRVAFNRTPIKGKVTITLEGNGKRWEQEAIAELSGAWDIPAHPRWLFPHPKRPDVYIASDTAVFRLIPPGRYRLSAEGIIGGKASVDVTTFPGKPKIVTMSEPVRHVRWQKRIEIKAGYVETIVVPLPR
ncbi:MAG: hypothetical protein NZ781_12665 [Armatimonadetes bacterium]|nr:hypothetical protein [Armatimonadota bacterium]